MFCEGRPFYKSIFPPIKRLNNTEQETLLCDYPNRPLESGVSPTLSFDATSSPAQHINYTSKRSIISSLLFTLNQPDSDAAHHVLAFRNKSSQKTTNSFYLIDKSLVDQSHPDWMMSDIRGYVHTCSTTFWQNKDAPLPETTYFGTSRSQLNKRYRADGTRPTNVNKKLQCATTQTFHESAVSPSLS